MTTRALTAWDHFRQAGVTVAGLWGSWSFGDNLAEVNRLTAQNQVPLAAAVLQTWTARLANRYGFASAAVMDAVGSPGHYLSVDVLFTP